MTAANEARAAGLGSLAAVARMTGKTQQCLRNWHRDNRELFDIIIAGCKARKAADDV